MMNPLSSSYIAGLVDGEGSVLLNNSAGSFRHPCLTISSNDVDLLRWVQAETGVGTIVAKTPKKPHHAMQFQWAVKGRKAIEVLSEIVQYMKLPKKSARARLIVDQYLTVTKRNGNYSKDERHIKENFEKQFFEL